MFLSDLSIKRPVLTSCVMLAMVILGLFSIKGLGLDQFPKVDIPVVTVSVAYPGASPDAVEQDVVRKIEEAVNPIEKVREISSTSQDGVGVITIFRRPSRNPSSRSSTRPSCRCSPWWCARMTPTRA